MGRNLRVIAMYREVDGGAGEGLWREGRGVVGEVNYWGLEKCVVQHSLLG